MERIKTAMILRSLCMNYPILNHWGYTIKKPIGLVFSHPEDIGTYIHSLSLYPRIISMTTKVAEAKEKLHHSNSEGTFLILNDISKINGTKMAEKIELMMQAAMLGEINECEAVTTAFMVFYKMIPENLYGRVFQIRIPKLPDNFKLIDMMELLPDSDQIAVVKDKINHLNSSTIEECVFKAAVAFMYPKLYEKRDLYLYKELMQTAESLVLLERMYQEEDEILEFALEALVDYTCNETTKIYSLPKLRKQEISDIKKAVYVKDEYMFIHENCFKEVMSGLYEISTIGCIKDSLLKNHILCSDKGEYTTKMNYYGEDGRLQRVRMMKLNMNGIIVDDTGMSLKDFLNVD